VDFPIVAMGYICIYINKYKYTSLNSWDSDDISWDLELLRTTINMVKQGILIVVTIVDNGYQSLPKFISNTSRKPW
jgi:nitrogen regulatory protein PII-like uncharacterized protein